MSIAKYTLWGMEEYLNMESKSLFDNIYIPDGIEKELLTDTIMLASNEYEPLYSNPYFMQEAIQKWFRTHYRTFDKWIKALNIEYDPLYNYDRTEEWTDDHEGTDSRSKDSKYSDTGLNKSNGSSESKMVNNLESKTEYGKTTTDELEVASYDSNSYEDREKHTIKDTGSDTIKDTGNVVNTGSDKNTLETSNSGNGEENEKGSDTYKNKHHGRMFGNIGVTTSQQMLESELEIARFNIYDQIADLFIMDFLLLVA